MAESIVLYRHKEAWGLPSSSSASIQVEVGLDRLTNQDWIWFLKQFSEAIVYLQAYIRFSGAPFNVKACASSSKSPTGDRRDVGF